VIGEDLRTVSRPARVADPAEGLSEEELQLAARNAGMPLEALRYDVTPAGLHYLLIHYDIPALDPATFRLTLDGTLRSPAASTLDDLRALPAVTRRVTMECAGNGRARLHPRPVSQPWLVEAVGTAEWTGTPLAPLLDAAGLADETVALVFTGADHGIERGVEQDYQRSLSVADARAEDVLLAYEMNGMPLLPQHGAPLRLVVPGWYGMAHVKWLVGITATDREFDGFQMRAYRRRERPDDPGTPLSRIEPRALLLPPGFPDFMSRERVLRPGRTVLSGRAWSGWGPIDRVDISPDGGGTWHETELAGSTGLAGPSELPAPSALDGSNTRHAWVPWSWTWDAEPGRHELVVRATDRTGRRQPLEEPWNRGGFANNLVQRVPVLVAD
jgi:DMSO/TMAO reductase YedYZ molybdopterin-dependent catalytic subunit